MSSRTLDLTQSNYERKQEREKNIEKMTQLATGALNDEDMDIENVPLDDDPEVSKMNPPVKTFENARKFLWDEDDEFEDDPYYKKKTTTSTPTFGSKKSFGKKKKKLTGGAGIFPINLSPRFQNDRGDASPAMYGDSEAGFSTIDMRSNPLGNDFHRAYRKSFVQYRSSGSDQERTSYLGGIFGGCYFYLCRPVVLCKQTTGKQRIMLMFAALFLALSIFGIVAIAKAGGGSSPEPVDNERYEGIRTIILDSGTTSEATLDNGDSAQSKALLWLTDNDPAKMEVEDDGLLQRYVVATFFFSTYQQPEDSASDNQDTNDNRNELALSPQWESTYNWMSEKDVCSWHGIHCEGGKQPKNKMMDEGNERHIKDFNLTANGVEGTIPSELAALDHLKALDLRNNTLTGTIPEALGNLVHLAHLSLNDNALSGSIPSELGLCKKLHILALDRNHQITGTIPKEFSDLVQLRYFGVHWNELSGPLLDASKLTHLEILEQGENKLTGTIPTEYGLLTNLEELRLRENKLIGTVPSELGNLSNLIVLHYSHNELRGTIPVSIEGLTSLVDFRFQHNEMTGPLPSEVGLLTNLGNLNMEDNKLTGELPDELKHLKKLHTFRFFRNDFRGAVPDEFCERDPPFKVLAGDCGENNAKVECECCTQCDGFK